MYINFDVVKYSLALTTKNDEQLGSESRGMTYYEDLKILLDKELPKDLRIQTFYHELAHAICDQTSFNNLLLSKLDEDYYEIFIDNLGKVLYNLFHKNDMKKLEKFVIGENNE